MLKFAMGAGSHPDRRLCVCPDGDLKEGANLLRTRMREDSIELKVFWNRFCQSTGGVRRHRRLFNGCFGQSAQRVAAQPQT
jgi:hypothetical protein